MREPVNRSFLSENPSKKQKSEENHKNPMTEKDVVVGLYVFLLSPLKDGITRSVDFGQKPKRREFIKLYKV